MNILKELFPYKHLDGRYYFRYYINYVSEGVLNHHYFGMEGGRCEVRVDESQYAIDEYRFLTDRQSWWIFRDLTECRNYNIIGLWIIRLILKYYYYDTRERIGGHKTPPRIALGKTGY